MKGQGAHITEHGGEPFDLTGAIDRAVTSNLSAPMVLRDWVILVLTESAKTDPVVGLTIAQLRQVIGEFRTEYSTGQTNVPPAKQHLRVAVDQLIGLNLVERVGMILGKDVMGRNTSAPGYRLVSND